MDGGSGSLSILDINRSGVYINRRRPISTGEAEESTGAPEYRPEKQKNRPEPPEYQPEKQKNRPEPPEYQPENRRIDRNHSNINRRSRGIDRSPRISTGETEESTGAPEYQPEEQKNQPEAPDIDRKNRRIDRRNKGIDRSHRISTGEAEESTVVAPEYQPVRPKPYKFTFSHKISAFCIFLLFHPSNALSQRENCYSLHKMPITPGCYGRIVLKHVRKGFQHDSSCGSYS
ncbi:hypothetical protein [Lentibacillus juripiscarius]|uniref:hypothetical protein n=1 Tax=Lentibacillus juripiscarius TaxID=257446 RepID=UPI0036D40D85